MGLLRVFGCHRCLYALTRGFRCFGLYSVFETMLFVL